MAMAGGILALALAWCTRAAAEEDLREALARDDECAAADEPGGCGFSALQLRGVPVAAPAAPLIGEDALRPAVSALPTRTCQQVLDKIVGNGKWDMNFYTANYNVASSEDITYSQLQYEGEQQVLGLFYDHNVQNVEFTRSGMDNPCSYASLWFYPRADHNGAFDLNDFICSRMAAAARKTGATCINLYRVSNVHEISMILDRFVVAGTVIDATIGGHGSNDPQGVLGLGATDEGQVEQDAPTSRMLQELGKGIVPGGLVFLDSCYSARNGLAQYVSGLIPHAWVMGGIVSLDNAIDMVSGTNGPLTVMSDFPSADYEVPEFQGGSQAIKVFGKGQDMGMAWDFGAPAWDPAPQR